MTCNLHMEQDVKMDHVIWGGVESTLVSLTSGAELADDDSASSSDEDEASYKGSAAPTVRRPISLAAPVEAKLCTVTMLEIELDGYGSEYSEQCSSVTTVGNSSYLEKNNCYSLGSGLHHAANADHVHGTSLRVAADQAKIAITAIFAQSKTFTTTATLASW
eukprot:CAMPEP_0178406542 /NCGR_PEP_ID=MMETSP0689_2-20121128/18964_1 /TAXON_ID=160604 /ORGANISM="Amphidinium massartii, Strain CS-259" /LENGTH=161 /DNA_ID=CAMNT_0020027583 /DNA_START=10 /DNA_END=493 /DNA_ORIENTATION=-